ncbi:MAG: PD-(D/E)XK nuclease family protein, partial [Oscillospiraceae bacterium]|nr:PD-(D/E)XK nuclease family protein [Oscillospiraceae bacterium]
MRRAAELCRESGYFDGAECFFDGFDEFSGSQLAFIKEICSSAEKTTFTLTTDERGSEKSVFLASSQLMLKLEAMSEDVTLTRMEKRYRGNPVCEMVRAQDMWQECDWICSQIYKLTDEGFRYRDIAVLMPDKAYGQILASAMKKYDIPAFVDIPQPLIDKSVVRFIIYALQALSFETDDLLRYVKSGFVRQENGRTISNIQADSLEQLCRCYGIERQDWLRPFPERADADGEMEKLRLEIIKPLQGLKKRIENADGTEMTEALCDFICREMDIGKSIYALYLEGRDENGKVIVDKKKQDEYSSIWEDVVEILESAHEALRGSRLTIGEFTDMLIQAFTSAEIAKPPQVLDAVTVGDVERSRFTKVRAVFICGMNQGVMPRPAKTTGNFTGSETQTLVSCGITIGGDRTSRMSKELFKLYRCVNLPEERLYITYPLLSDSFAQLTPSSVTEDIERYFGISTKGADEYGADFYCRTEKAAKRYLSKIYSDYSRKHEKTAITKLLGGDPFDAVMKDTGERHILSAGYAAKLMDKATYSPTALNKINNCKYSFFCHYGLGIKERDKRELGAMLTGNAVHFCLEKLLNEQGERLASLSDKEISDHVKGSLSAYLRDELAEGFGAGERFSYQVKRLEELA